MQHSITHGDVFLAYFNKIWGIPVVIGDSKQPKSNIDTAWLDLLYIAHGAI
jgi:hypothetical protein